MRMKNLSNFFIGMLAMCALAGCSDNEVNGNEPDIYPVHPEDAVYMNVDIQLPVAGGSTRSQTNTDGGDYGTSTDGTETGHDHENKVNGVLIVLADKSNNFIAAGEHNSLPVVDSKGVVTSTQKINKSTLAAYYTTNGKNGVLNEGKDGIKIYVFCNPTMELKSIFTKENISNTWVNAIATLEEDSKNGVTTGTAIWGGNDHKAGFLMTTASSQNIDKKIPKNFADWDDYTSEKNAFNFSGENNNGNDSKYINNQGNIKVERAVARFDFKDGSENQDRKYVVAKKDDKPSLYVQLNRIALVNMSKHFYYLRRVSADGKLTNAEICGTEYPTNYVVDTDADEKVQNIDKKYPYGTFFNFCLGHQTSTDWSIDETAREQWFSELITDVLENDEDKDDSWNNNHSRDGYHIWRYVTENTIPGIEEQKNGISTGIVFKGKILPAEGTGTPTPKTLQEALTKATGNPDTDPILYSYSDKLYVRWTEVREAALSPEANEEFKKAVFGTPTNAPSESTYSDDEESPDYLWNIWYNTKNHNDATSLTAFKKVVTDKDHQFTLYQSSKDETDGNGYYCYYFYWNRHNDNGNNGVMGPMEFAVVRNNVYKLSVTEISRLGHPRVTENDPDPVKPDNPDEKGDIFFKLSVEVLPWVVRVNDIEF